MRRFLKRLKKGIKSACLTAALVTCWQVGQPAPALAVIDLKFSGEVSPTVNDVSHLWLIYGSNYTASLYDWQAVKLGDFTAGQTSSFTVFGEVENGFNFKWGVAGLYGDTSGGQYTEGVNGVTLGLPEIDEGETWDSHVFTTIDTMFDYLLNDNGDDLAASHFMYPYYDNDFYSDGTISNLFDFSTATANGDMTLEYEIVPEPITIILLGAGGIVVLRRRRDKD